MSVCGNDSLSPNLLCAHHHHLQYDRITCVPFSVSRLTGNFVVVVYVYNSPSPLKFPQLSSDWLGSCSCCSLSKKYMRIIKSSQCNMRTHLHVCLYHLSLDQKCGDAFCKASTVFSSITARRALARYFSRNHKPRSMTSYTNYCSTHKKR